MKKRLVLNWVLWIDSHRQLSILLLIIGAIAIIYPRFNGNDIGIIRPFVGLHNGEVSFDVKNYVNFTEFFKNRMPLDSVVVPYSYRPLVPFLASLLPGDSLLGIVIVNILGLIVSIISIFFILKKQFPDFGLQITGCFLYIFSFPVLYYAPGGYIDSFALCLICLIFLCTVYRKHYLLPLLFLLGGFTKEVIIIVAPFIAIYFICKGKEIRGYRRKTYFIFIASVLLFIFAYSYCRVVFGSVNNFVWSPVLSTFKENLSRPKTYISFILSFGVVGIIAFVKIIRDIKVFFAGSKKNILIFMKKYPFSPHLGAILSSLLLCFYSLVAAYADGRFIWTAYPFFICLVIAFIAESNNITEKAEKEVMKKELFSD